MNEGKKMSFLDYIGEFQANGKTKNGRSYHINGKMRLEEKTEKKETKVKSLKVKKNKFGEIIGYE